MFIGNVLGISQRTSSPVFEKLGIGADPYYDIQIQKSSAGNIILSVVNLNTDGGSAFVLGETETLTQFYLLRNGSTHATDPDLITMYLEGDFYLAGSSSTASVNVPAVGGSLETVLVTCIISPYL